MKTLTVQYLANLPGYLPRDCVPEACFPLHMAIPSFGASCPVRLLQRSPFAGVVAGGASHTVLNTRPCCFISWPGPPHPHHHRDNGPEHHCVTLAARRQCGPSA